MRIFEQGNEMTNTELKEKNNTWNNGQCGFVELQVGCMSLNLGGS